MNRYLGPCGFDGPCRDFRHRRRRPQGCRFCGDRDPHKDRFPPYRRYGSWYDNNRYFRNASADMMDTGEPYVVNIEEATENNTFFRQVIWTGQHSQTVLMSIPAGGDIGLELHPDTDQFIRIEEGQGLTVMGPDRTNLNYQVPVGPDYAIFIPAGTWHNLINTGNRPLKLYTIYAPPQHPRGTIHRTRAEADAAEH